VHKHNVEATIGKLVPVMTSALSLGIARRSQTPSGCMQVLINASNLTENSALEPSLSRTFWRLREQPPSTWTLARGLLFHDTPPPDSPEPPLEYQASPEGVPKHNLLFASKNYDFLCRRQAVHLAKAPLASPSGSLRPEVHVIDSI